MPLEIFVEAKKLELIRNTSPEHCDAWAISSLTYSPVIAYCASPSVFTYKTVSEQQSSEAQTRQPQTVQMPRTGEVLRHFRQTAPWPKERMGKKEKGSAKRRGRRREGGQRERELEGIVMDGCCGGNGVIDVDDDSRGTTEPIVFDDDDDDDESRREEDCVEILAEVSKKK